ncbi:hypothetical protein Tcan_01066, partial [Toxocara canis]
RQELPLRRYISTVFWKNVPYRAQHPYSSATQYGEIIRHGECGDLSLKYPSSGQLRIWRLKRVNFKPFASSVNFEQRLDESMRCAIPVHVQKTTLMPTHVTVAHGNTRRKVQSEQMWSGTWDVGNPQLS